MTARRGFGARLIGWGVTLALLAYPTAFRRRFGDELSADVWSVFEAAGVSGALVHLVSLIVPGLTERATAVRQLLWTPPVGQRLYEPQARRAAFWDALFWDIRRTLRQTRRTPFVTMLAVLALALGIGATTAVYSAIDAAFFRPLPFPHPQQLVRLADVFVPINYSTPERTDDAPRMALRAAPFSVTSLAAMRDVFSHSAAFASGALNLGTGPEPLRIDVTFVTAEFFPLLGHPAARGRVFTADEARNGVPRTVLSHRLWRTHFGANESIVGDAVLLNDVPHEVVGVMPEDFRFPAAAQAWVPMPVPVPWSLVHEAFRNFLPVVVLARLAPGGHDRGRG